VARDESIEFLKKLTTCPQKRRVYFRDEFKPVWFLANFRLKIRENINDLMLKNNFFLLGRWLILSIISKNRFN